MPRGGHIRSGPAPLEARVRALRGSKTRGRTRAASDPRTGNAPVAEPGWPDRPSHLGVVGRQEWTRLGTLLEHEGRLTKSDGPTLAIAAHAFEIAMQVRGKRLRATKSTYLQYAAAERNALEQYRKTMNDLCLNQATRGKAPRSYVMEPESKLAQFIRRVK
jgi:phage terminase small subunit